LYSAENLLLKKQVSQNVEHKGTPRTQRTLLMFVAGSFARLKARNGPKALRISRTLSSETDGGMLPTKILSGESGTFVDTTPGTTGASGTVGVRAYKI
jgi:hypothetical protein